MALRVQAQLEGYVDPRQRQLEEDEVMRMLPQNLLMDLVDEAHGPTLAAHQLFHEFRDANVRAVRHLCFAAVEEIAVQQDEKIFQVGDACSRMLFCANGTLEYIFKRVGLQ